MMHGIDPSAYYRPEEAVRLIPGRPHRATLWRWMLKGVGSGVNYRRLETLKIGHSRLISGQALLDFIHWKPPAEAAPRIRTPAERNRAAEAAARELEKLGV